VVFSKSVFKKSFKRVSKKSFQKEFQKEFQSQSRNVYVLSTDRKEEKTHALLPSLSVALSNCIIDDNMVSMRV